MDLIEIAEHIKGKEMKNDRLNFAETVRAYLSWNAETLFGVFSQYKYNREWDSVLNGLMDKYEGEIGGLSKCTATFGSAEVWIENRWYASGHVWMDYTVKKYRPSVRTMGRLHKRADVLLKKLEEEDKMRELARYKQMLEDV